jgi:hypothetical protein
MGRHRGFLNVGSLVVFCLMELGPVVSPTRAQTTINANWMYVTGAPNWTTASNWSCNCVPNNSSADVFNVAIPSGNQVFLDDTSSVASATINSLSLLGAAPEFGGFLHVENGESLTILGNASVGSGLLGVDDNYTSFLPNGGSTLHVGGNLTTSPSGFAVEIGNSRMALASTVTVAGTFAADLLMFGGKATGAPALLTVGGAAPSVLVANFLLEGDTGGAAVQYGSGGVTQIGDGSAISTNVTLDGPNAFMELSSAPGSNSALTGLRTIASNGQLYLGSALDTTGALTNNGVLSVDGGALNLGGSLTNIGSLGVAGYFRGASLITGTLTVSANLTNSASMELDLAQGSVSGNVDNAGTLTVQEAASLTANKFSNTGTVDVGGVSTNAGAPGTPLSAASLTVNAGGTYRQTAGLTDVNGTLMAPSVDITGGALSGGGTVTGHLVNGAIVTPSTAAPNIIPATLTTDGDYTQNADGTLLVDIASATDFSILKVTGKASLDGTVDFDFLNGYVPGPNTDFAFLKVGNVAGDFTTLEFTNLYDCTTCTFNLTTLSLEIGSHAPSDVPEVSPLILFATGSLGLAAVLRKKQWSAIND